MPTTFYTEMEFERAQVSDRTARNFYNSLTDISRKAWRERYKDTRPECNKEGKMWDYIPLEYDAVVSGIHSVLDAIKKSSLRGYRFLEVGCGPGLIQNIAYSYGAMSNGIELDPFWKEHTYGGFGAYWGDALEFPDYHKYDIIYYYCPIKDKVLQQKLEEKIEDDAKVGTFILAYLKQSQKIEKDSRFKRCSNYLFQKISMEEKPVRKSKVKLDKAA